MTEDSITGGFSGNPFLFGEANNKWQQLIDAQVSLAQSGTNTITHANAKEMLKLPVNLPQENKSFNNLKQMDIVCDVLLTIDHPFCSYISKHLEQFEHFATAWERHELPDRQMLPAKDVLHL